MKKVKLFFTGVKKGLSKFSHNVSIIVNSVLLLAVYVIGVGFTSLLAKILGKRFLNTKTSEKRNSYWSDLDLKKKPIKEYYRQF
mgnify:CR=1 FL=1|tara:strand:+ start:235 stop:486 length:252 start_codon:yes stop_codon:yes gene_type:complete